jgi:hypothetical protein
MKTVIVPVSTGVLAFVLGMFCAPARLDSKIAKDNAILRQQVELYKKMVETYEAERAAIKDATHPEKNAVKSVVLPLATLGSPFDREPVI